MIKKMNNTQKINFYRENGYIKIKNIFTKKEIKKLKEYVDQINRFKPKKGKWMIYFDSFKNKEFLTRTENFIDYHKGIKKILNKKIFNKFISDMVGSRIILFKDKINWKYPGAKGFEPHQDAQVWEDLYKKIKSFFSVTVSVDKTDEKNGCLEIVPKKHNVGLLGNNKSAIPNSIVKKMNWKKIKTKPGEVIVFDAYTPHHSNGNKSKKPRRMIYLTYNAKKDGDLRKNYYKNKRISFPPNNERKKGKKYKYLI